MNISINETLWESPPTYADAVRGELTNSQGRVYWQMCDGSYFTVVDGKNYFTNCEGNIVTSIGGFYEKEEEEKEVRRFCCFETSPEQYKTLCIASVIFCVGLVVIISVPVIAWFLEG